MRKSIFVLFVIVFALSSCQKDSTIEPDGFEGMVLNNDANALTQRITYINQPLKLSGGLKSTPAFTLIAEAASPVVNGVRLSASYVHRRFQNVYVTYNERGNGFGGAIVVFNVSNPSSPTIVSEMTFSNIDINACDINSNGNVLYLAGSSKNQGAVVLIMNLNFQGIISTQPSQVVVHKVGNAASANGIIQANRWIYVSAGNTNGGLYAYDRSSLTLIESDLYHGAKFSAANGRANGDKHLSLEVNQTNQAFLHVYTVGTVDHNDELIWPLGSVVHQNVEPEFTSFGKATLFIKPGESTCYVSMAMNGMKAVNIFTGNLIYESPSGMITDGNTNAVSADSKYIYMANGAQGLYIAKAPQSGTVVDIIGIWDDPAYPGSANHVFSDDNHIFLAKGKEGGLKIIRED